MTEQTQHSYHPARGLIMTLIVLLGLNAMFGSAGAWSDWQEITMLQDAVTGNITTEEAFANDARQALIALAQLGLLVVTAVFFCMWIHRANRNARALGAAEEMKFTPGWCVGWFFIPFANLFKPYQAVKEIWMASEPDDAKRWQSRGHIVSAWWACWILGGVVDRIAGRMALRADSINEMITASWLTLASGVALVITAGFAILVIRDIRDRQDTRHQQLTAFGRSAPQSGSEPTSTLSSDIPQADIDTATPFFPGAVRDDFAA